MKYFLVGFMGSGKSTIGKLLSERLNIKYFDLDDVIQKQENKSISEIFSIKGEDYFRILEKKYLNQLMIKDQFIISTGGGTPIHNNMMYLMQKNGRCIYLKCSSEILFNRLKNNKKKRPLISNLSEEKLKIFIEKTLSERKMFYETSEHIFYNNTEKEKIEIINFLG